MYPNAWKYVEARFIVINLDEAYPVEEQKKEARFPAILRVNNQ